MINVLIYLNLDLASSIAIRYAQELSRLLKMAVQPIHIKEPEQKGPSFGTGWVRRTWENAILKKGEEEIAHLLKTENIHISCIGKPRVIVGEREEELLRELRQGGYDLFMEGILSTFDLSSFYNILQSRLYKNLPCPFIMVKNIAPLNKCLLLVGEEVDISYLLGNFLNTFAGIKIPVEILYFIYKESGEISFVEKKEMVPAIQHVEEALREAGLKVGDGRVAMGSPDKLSELVKDYGLVASSIKDSFNKKSPLLRLLGRTLSPLYLC